MIYENKFTLIDKGNKKNSSKTQNYNNNKVIQNILSHNFIVEIKTGNSF